MAKPPVILLAFANDREGQFLRSIAEEQRRIRKALAPLVEKKLVQLEELPNAAASDIFEAFRQFGDRVRIFHYGGHAQDLDVLLNGSDRPMDVRGFAQFLGQQKNLELVFMNGCATAAQRAPFQDAGIPRLILTDTPISDQAALQFASQFYQSLAVGHPVKRSYLEAEGSTIAQLGDQRRSLVLDQGATSTSEVDTGLPWKLYDSSTAAWSLPTKMPFPWMRVAIAGAILLLLGIGGLWLRQNALPFELQVSTQYPAGVQEVHFGKSNGSSQQKNTLYHELHFLFPDGAESLGLLKDGRLDLPNVTGRMKEVSLRLNSSLWKLTDSVLQISRSPQVISLDWREDVSVIHGKVRNDAGPLAGVAVRIGEQVEISDEAGRFRMKLDENSLPTLELRVEFSKIGYQTITVPIHIANRAKALDQYLAPAQSVGDL